MIFWCRGVPPDDSPQHINHKYIPPPNKFEIARSVPPPRALLIHTILITKKSKMIHQKILMPNSRVVFSFIQKAEAPPPPHHKNFFLQNFLINFCVHYEILFVREFLISSNRNKKNVEIFYNFCRFGQVDESSTTDREHKCTYFLEFFFRKLAEPRS